MAAPLEPHLFRSVSHKEPCSCGASFEKRRSTSFDETLGELATACSSLCPGAGTDGTSQPTKAKASFWQGRVWKFGRGKKGAMGPKETLAVVAEKEEGTLPALKKLLRKLQPKGKDGRRPAVCSSGLDLQVASRVETSMNKAEGNINSLCNQAERQQSLHSVHPEPFAVRKHSSTAISIWERRRTTQPCALDLGNLNVTGLKHLQRPR